MKFGLNIVPVPAGQLADVGHRAEELGFDALYYGEHIAVPVTLKTPYPGKVGYNAMTYQLECYVALGHLAAATKRVRLGTGITILPIRHPLQTARAISSVDNLSNGRLDLAIGVGSIVDEYAAMGVDYDTRGARLDEILDIFDLLWSEKTPSYDGKFYNFEPIGFLPKPVQKPRPPLYVGSHSKVALERGARRADGWYGAVYTPDDVRRIKDIVTPLLKQNGRDPAAFKYTLIHAAGEGIPPRREEVAAYEALGVEMMVISPWGMPERGSITGKLEDLARHLKLGR